MVHLEHKYFYPVFEFVFKIIIVLSFKFFFLGQRRIFDSSFMLHRFIFSFLKNIKLKLVILVVMMRFIFNRLQELIFTTFIYFERSPNNNIRKSFWFKKGWTRDLIRIETLGFAKIADSVKLPISIFGFWPLGGAKLFLRSRPLN